METQEASVVKDDGRWLRILTVAMAMVALAPVAGMVLAFAILPALPIVLVIGYVLGPMNWLEDQGFGARDKEDEEAEAGHFVHAHAHWHA